MGQRRVGWALVICGLSGLVAGCGDPPPHPSVAPIEVVLDGCQLNRPSVAAGTHDVSMVGTGSIRLLDSAGNAVLESTGNSAVPESVALKAGTLTVECRNADGSTTGSATLSVTTE